MPFIVWWLGPDPEPLPTRVSRNIEQPLRDSAALTEEQGPSKLDRLHGSPGGDGIHGTRPLSCVPLRRGSAGGEWLRLEAQGGGAMADKEQSGTSSSQTGNTGTKGENAADVTTKDLGKTGNTGTRSGQSGDTSKGETVTRGSEK
jgi:hypothetical protein